MDTDYRALCAELLDAMDGWHQAVFETGTGWVRPDETYLLDRARAALAQPAPPAAGEVGEGVTDEAAVEAAAELIYAEAMEWAAKTPIPHGHCNIPAWQHGGNSDAQDVARRVARAVLARFGHHSPDATKMVGPAEGEVAELVAWLRGANWDSKRQTLATRAADLLSQRHPAPVPVAVPEGMESASVVGEPSDEDIDAWITECADATRYGPLQHYWAFDVGFGDVRDIARAVLARFGNHSPDARKMVGPAEGEAGELASLIREAVRAWVAWEEGAVMLNNMTEVQLTRAADLLEQCHPAPVPVAERLPGPKDCDAELYCWRWNTIGGLWARQPLARSWYEFESHWLPAHALPLPSDAGQSPA